MSRAPELEPHSGSWVIVYANTNSSVCETSDRRVADVFAADPAFIVHTGAQWLRLNARGSAPVRVPPPLPQVYAKDPTMKNRWVVFEVTPDGHKRLYSCNRSRRGQMPRIEWPAAATDETSLDAWLRVSPQPEDLA